MNKSIAAVNADVYHLSENLLKWQQMLHTGTIPVACITF